MKISRIFLLERAAVVAHRSASISSAASIHSERLKRVNDDSIHPSTPGMAHMRPLVAFRSNSFSPLVYPKMNDQEGNRFNWRL